MGSSVSASINLKELSSDRATSISAADILSLVIALMPAVFAETVIGVFVKSACSFGVGLKKAMTFQNRP